MAVKRITPFVVIVAVCLVGLGRLTLAQGADFRIGPWVMGSGGQSQTTDFQVQGSAGQSNVGIAEGGEFRLKGGMWPSMPVVVNGGPSRVLLPVVLRQNPVIVDPPPTPATWQRVGAAGLLAASLDIQGDQLFVADRRAFTVGGGLYRRSLASCETTLTTALTRIDTIQAPGFSVVFQGDRGVLAAFEGKIYHTSDAGNRWTQTTSRIINPRTVAAATDGRFYAGTEAAGIYQSGDGGVTWGRLDDAAAPADTNTIRLDTRDTTKLWIGTHGATAPGVQILTITTGEITPSSNGLTTSASREVYDFEFDSAGVIYIATDDGVFKGNSVDAWQPFGLQGRVQARSLAVVGNQLYAGAQSAGVWRRPLAGGDWQPVTSDGWSPSYTVRDLLHDSTYCKGVLAATSDGVWVYK